MQRHDSLTLEEYTEEVKKWLMKDSYRYSSEGAEKCAMNSMKLIRESYEYGESARDCAIDIGYCCG